MIDPFATFLGMLLAGLICFVVLMAASTKPSRNDEAVEEDTNP